MKKSLKLIILFFSIVMGIILLKLPTDSQAATINMVYVGNIDEPEVGNIPDRTASTGKDYSIYGDIDWYEVDTDKFLENNDKFQYGHIYRMIVWVKANVGNEFNTSGSMPNVTGYINNKIATVNKAYGEAAYEVIELIYEYDLTQIKNIQLSGGAIPVIGENYPDKNSWSIPNGEHYTMGNRYRWYDITADRLMSSEYKTFKENNVYELSIMFYPEEGYEFADAEIMTAVLTDFSLSNYNVSIEVGGISETQAKNRLVTFTFKKLAPDDIVITEVSIENGAFPLTGEQPDYSWAVSDRVHYSIYGTLHWTSPNENNRTVYPSDTFDKGQTYFLFINLIPEDGYRFYSFIENVTLTDISDEWFLYSSSVNEDTKVLTLWFSMTAKNPSHTVRFESNGGSSIDSQTVESGKTIIRPYQDPVKDGYTFVDWYVGTRLNYVYDFSKPVTSDFTLYAKWRENLNGLVNVNGKMSYYVDGIIQSEYTGLVEHEGEWYYVQNGIVVWGVDGLTYINGIWYYLENSILQDNYTGLVQLGKDWYYVQNGKLYWGERTLVQHGGTWYYVKNSTLDWNYTGLCYYNKNWYYIQKGQLNWGVETLVQYNGTWYYVKNSTLDWNYTGLCYYNKNWYYIQKGQLNWGIETLVYHYGTWYYVKNSTLDWNYTGLCYYNKNWYYIQKGQLNWGIETLVYHYGTWYYVQNSTLDWNFTGLCEYNGTKYYIQKGELHWGYNGKVTYKGIEYQIKNSMAV